MNQFELFTAIFYVLDAAWDKSRDEELGDFLSGANPFLFEDSGSADPAVFAEFCEQVPPEISVDESYQIACQYIESLHDRKIRDAFFSFDEQAWIKRLKEYLSAPHKR